MRIYRCYHPGELLPGSRITLEEGESRHLSAVRRAKVGDEALLFNGQGVEAAGKIVGLSRQTMLEILRETRRDPLPATLEVACALTKSGAYDDMIQRAVELGMTAFRPIITARTVVELQEKRAEKKTERWQKLTLEALKQCERLWAPQVHGQQDFAAALASATEQGNLPVFLQERASEVPLLADHARAHPSQPMTLFIGPEGGWTEGEIERAVREGAAAVSLGTQAILRTETAVLAALAIIQGSAGIPPVQKPSEELR